MVKELCECYWNNLDSITIVVMDSEYPHENKVKIAEIGKDASQKWVISVKNLTIKEFEQEKKNEYTFNIYRKVPDYVFKRAFQSIYTEMLLQFGLNGQKDQLNLLNTLFLL